MWMPRLDDTARIRAMLDLDRPWAAYMLADLTPPYRDHCEWYSTPGAEALLLVFRGFATPVIVAAGDAARLPVLIEEAGRPPVVYAALRPDGAQVLARAGYALSGEHSMVRMLLDPAGFSPCSLPGTVRLGPAEASAVASLYADGAATGETPPFYDATMLSSGLYYGVFEDGALAAAAGTHVFAPEESVACIGNVYTRRDRRGRGLAAGLTSALASHLLSLGIRTIALNVDQRNSTARGIYRRLGLFDYCPFIEAQARRCG